MGIDWDKAVLGPTIGVFGEPAQYLPAAGGSFAISGVYDEAYKDVQQLDPLSANETMPVLGVRLASLPAEPQQGDQVRVPSVGKLFYVKDVRPDGHGWAKLMLSDTGQP